VHGDRSAGNVESQQCIARVVAAFQFGYVADDMIVMHLHIGGLTEEFNGVAIRAGGAGSDTEYLGGIFPPTGFHARAVILAACALQDNAVTHGYGRPVRQRDPADLLRAGFGEDDRMAVEVQLDAISGDPNGRTRGAKVSSQKVGGSGSVEHIGWFLGLVGEVYGFGTRCCGQGPIVTRQRFSMGDHDHPVMVGLACFEVGQSMKMCPARNRGNFRSPAICRCGSVFQVSDRFLCESIHLPVDDRGSFRNVLPVFRKGRLYLFTWADCAGNRIQQEQQDGELQGSIHDALFSLFVLSLRDPLRIPSRRFSQETLFEKKRLALLMLHAFASEGAFLPRTGPLYLDSAGMGSVRC